MNGEEQVRDDILFYAFRYGLGRMTYAVSTISEYLIRHKEWLTERSKRLIIQEITKAIDNDEAGHDCDIESWKKLRDALTVVKSGK